MEVRGDQATLTFCGQQLKADARSEGATTIMVRPERLGLLTPGVDVPLEHNWADALVEDVMYLGATRKVTLRLSDGSAGVGDRTRLGGACRRERGSARSSHWHPRAGVLL